MEGLNGSQLQDEDCSNRKRSFSKFEKRAILFQNPPPPAQIHSLHLEYNRISVERS